MIKHLIFDFDGVIIDSEILAAKAFSDVLKQMNIQNQYSTKIIAEKFAGNKMVFVAEEIAKVHSISNKQVYLNKVMKLTSKYYNDQLKSIEGIDNFLKMNTLNRFICSNSGKKRIIKGLEIVNLSKLFDYNKIYTFEMVEKPKPAPDVYLKLIEENNIDRNEALVLEDIVAGVRSAILSGLNVVGVTIGSHWQGRSSELLTNEGTIAILKSYKDFNKLLK